jgi:hypothetical protein
MQSISQTGIESIKLAGKNFRSVDKTELLKTADKFGLTLVDFEENILPNGKSFLTYTLTVKNNEPT